jgi:hypothetical protein
VRLACVPNRARHRCVVRHRAYPGNLPLATRVISPVGAGILVLAAAHVAVNEIVHAFVDTALIVRRDCRRLGHRRGLHIGDLPIRYVQAQENGIRITIEGHENGRLAGSR